MVTVLETVYLQRNGRDAESFGEPHDFVLRQDEQPWLRETDVGPDWVRLSYGWLDSPSLVLLANPRQPQDSKPLVRTPNHPHVEEGTPLPSQGPLGREGLVLEVAFSSGRERVPSRTMHGGEETAERSADLLVFPGESARFCPAPGRAAWLRCRGGVRKYRLAALPGR